MIDEHILQQLQQLTRAVKRYVSLFAELGIAPERLEFQGPVSLAQMMQEYADVDIGLDPFPYNGGTTTLEAMWMWVPVITKEGGAFVSRMGSSFMRAAGLDNLVVTIDEGYVAAAKDLASNRVALLGLKRDLRGRLIERSTWQFQKYVNGFSELLESMWPPSRI